MYVYATLANLHKDLYKQTASQTTSQSFREEPTLLFLVFAETTGVRQRATHCHSTTAIPLQLPSRNTPQFN